MYPDRELRRLALHKAAVRRRIARHRAECAAAAVRVTRPLAWLERLLTLWRKLAPFAAVPLGLLVTRSVTRRSKILGTLTRWGPLALGAARWIRSTLQAKTAPAAERNGDR